MALPELKPDMSEDAIDGVISDAKLASDFMRSMSHEGRFTLLCHLTRGDKSVYELMHLLSTRQSAVSQQLSRLRLEGIVECRRVGKRMVYSLRDDRPAQVIELLQRMFRAA